MRIIHTADWHLGHKLHDKSQLEEQALFLDWLEQVIYEKEVDMLLVSGDVFDTANPPTEATTLYYTFLAKICLSANSPCQQVVITGGNHDSPGLLNSAAPVLNHISTEIIGKATDEVADEVFEFDIAGEKIIVAAVPYLRDKDIRNQTLNERFEDPGNRYKQALIRHYQAVAEICASKQTAKTPILAMGHLFAVGGTTSDSEQSIYVGGQGDIGADDFPPIFDYIALGHLHRPQTIAGNKKVRYSGSPYKLSFSEVGHKNSIELLETDQQGKLTRENILVPTFRPILRIEGDSQACLDQLKAYDEKHTAPLIAWAELVLDEKTPNLLSLQKATAGFSNVEVLKYSLNRAKSLHSLEDLAKQSKVIAELTPVEVFDKLCTDQEVDQAKRTRMNDLFHEILNQAQNQ